jgi:hypothetical protein
VSGALIDRIAWQLATVIVAFPIFAIINGLIERSLRRRPDLLDSPVRSWLTYIALVGAALVVLGACRSMHVDRFGAECFDDTRRDEGATP